MSQPAPLPVEPIAYEVVAVEDAWPKVVRVMAILGLMLAVGRMLTAVSTLWYLVPLRPFTNISLGTTQWAGMWLRFVAGAVFGVGLMIGAIGVYNARRWARAWLLIEESLFVLVHLLIAVLGMTSGVPSLRSAEWLFAGVNTLSGLPLNIAYPLAVYLLFRGRRFGSLRT